MCSFLFSFSLFIFYHIKKPTYYICIQRTRLIMIYFLFLLPIWTLKTVTGFSSVCLANWNIPMINVFLVLLSISCDCYLKFDLMCAKQYFIIKTHFSSFLFVLGVHFKSKQTYRPGNWIKSPGFFWKKNQKKPLSPTTVCFSFLSLFVCPIFSLSLFSLCVFR